MSYTVYDFSETLARLDKEEHGIDRSDVSRCLAAYGRSGDYSEWEGGFLLELIDARLAWINGWCDTTGWGCQDGITVRVHPGPPPDLAALTPGAWPPTDDEYNERPEEIDVDPADLNRYLRGEIDEFYETPV
jgi:hypothetical protein